MSKYLITGGEGFIGSRIAQKTAGISYDIKSGYDVLDGQQLAGAISNVGGIFHCAAKISVPESILKPDEYYRTNVRGTENIVTIAGTFGKKIVFSSSAAVYGESSIPVIEESILNPKSPYAQNKIDGEDILKASPVAHISLRYFNVYGPGQSPEYAGVITFFIINALKGEDLIIYGDGNQVRDFVFVDDIVHANILAMNHQNKSYEVFNIASGVETSINTLAEIIIRLTGSNSKIVYQSPRRGDIVYSQADVSKTEKILGWKAQVSLEEGLKETISYYKQGQF